MGNLGLYRREAPGGIGEPGTSCVTRAFDGDRCSIT
jgi:hypothetical protein